MDSKIVDYKKWIKKMDNIEMNNKKVKSNKKNKICISNVICSKIVRPDFLVKLILCIALEMSTLYDAIHLINLEYQSVETENANLLMYLLMVFTNPYIAYYSVLIAFAILVSDIVYEEYLTKNIYLKYGSRRNMYFGMLKLTAAFSLLFIGLFFLMAVIMGWCGGLKLSFAYTDNAIKLWADEQEVYLLRTTSIYLPVSILKYDCLLILGMVILKYYVGLILLSMIGLVFSIKKDSVQYGALAILLTLFFNIAVLDYYGPWKFYHIGISVDLSAIFGYATLQRFFIYDFAGVKKDVVILFGDTMLTGGIWFVVLSVVICHLLRKKDI